MEGTASGQRVRPASSGGSEITEDGALRHKDLNTEGLLSLTHGKSALQD